MNVLHIPAAPIPQPVALARANMPPAAPTTGDNSGFFLGGARRASAEADPLAAAATTLKVHRNGTIFREGGSATQVYEVVHGLVRLYKLLPDGRRQIIGFLEADDYLGLTFSEAYVFSAEAVTDTVLRRIPRARFDAVLDVQPSLQRRLLAMATTELVAAQDQMLLLG